MTSPKLGWAFWGVVVVMSAGLVLIASDHLRRGGVVMAGGLGLGALLRLVLPARTAGGLVLRARLVDVAVMTVLSAGLLVTSLVLDLRPRG